MKKITLLILAAIIFVPSVFLAQYTNAVRIKIEGNGYSDETIVRFIDDATPNFDTYYDAFKIVIYQSIHYRFIIKILVLKFTQLSL